MNNLPPNSLAGRSVRHILHGNSNLTALRREGPLVITRGEGIYVYDETGRQYLEGLSGLWCASLGFSEPELEKAAAEQMSRLPNYHTNLHKSIDVAVELGERLTGMVPMSNARTFFSTTGSEANDFLTKFVWFYNNVLDRPKKKKIISRERGYHGATIVSGSMTGIPASQAGYDLPVPQIVFTENPHYFKNGLPGESLDDFATRMADSLEKTILAEGPETVAAFIAEPCTAAGGVIIPPEGYFEKLQAVLNRYDVLFMADEVVTGFGRTGNMFGSETFNIKPDTMTFAKGLSAAFSPISAAVISGDMYDVIEQGSDKYGVFAHGSTYSGHPLGCAIALRTLELIEERDVIGNVRRVAPVFAERMARLAKRNIVGEVRHSGLLGAVEFYKNRETKTPFDSSLKLAAKIMDRALENGLIVRAIGYGDTVAMCPPLIITEAQIHDMFDRLERAIDDVQRDHL